MKGSSILRLSVFVIICTSILGAVVVSNRKLAPPGEPDFSGNGGSGYGSGNAYGEGAGDAGPGGLAKGTGTGGGEGGGSGKGDSDFSTGSGGGSSSSNGYGKLSLVQTFLLYCAVLTEIFHFHQVLEEDSMVAVAMVTQKRKLVEAVNHTPLEAEDAAMG